MATLQKQGVPIPSHLGGNNAPQSRPTGSSAAPRQSATRSATRQSSQSVSHRQSRNSTRPQSDSGGMVSPVSAGSNAVSGVGMLEAEFVLGMLLLVLLMFSSKSDSTAGKIMSTMKRGTLICAVFFVLALVAGIGPGASKFAKAFGALVIVAILVTSDMTTVLSDLDAIIKNDWVPTSEAGTDTSADSGTAATTAANPITTAAKDAADKALGLSSGSPAANAFWAAVNDSNTPGKLFNPADEAKGTLNTLKAFADAFTGLFS
jgi:hypothetical protein